jgi:hypothetical protein
VIPAWDAAWRYLCACSLTPLPRDSTSLFSPTQCDFVSQRLDKGLDVATITKEVLHHCLASDTASAAGVGCDNMTFLLVLLNQ